MAAVYTLKTEGESPLDLKTVKSYLKGPPSADDSLIESLIAAATSWGQKYTQREFTDNTYTLLLDAFTTRICLRRDPVDSITFIKHLVSDSQVTVATSVYYLKKDVQFSEILLQEDQEWPDDTDDREQAIEIEFVTEAINGIEQAKQAMLRHIASLYRNRGDCSIEDAAKESGAKTLYDLVSIPKF